MIQAEDRDRFNQGRERMTSWFDTQGQAVRARWENLNLGARFDRARNTLANAIGKFADIIRGRNKSISNAKSLVAAS